MWETGVPKKDGIYLCKVNGSLYILEFLSEIGNFFDEDEFGIHLFKNVDGWLLESEAIRILNNKSTT